MSDWAKTEREDRLAAIQSGFPKRNKNLGGDPSLSGQQPRGMDEYGEQYGRFDDNLDAQAQELLQHVMSYQNRADLGSEGAWPSGEQYPTDQDLEWMLKWMLERGEGEKKGLAKLFSPPGNPVDDRYRKDIRQADISRRN